MATYYIAKTGNDGWAGTLPQPWLTINKANITLVAGDIVYVRTGTYDEVIHPANAGAGGNRITYGNYLTEVVTVRGVNAPPYFIADLDRDYITVDGFTFKHIADKTDLKYGYAEVTADHCEVLDCIIARDSPDDIWQRWLDDYEERGVRVSGDYALVSGCHISGVNMGVRLTTSPHYCEVTGCTITTCSQSGIVISGIAGGEMQGHYIHGNTIERSAVEDGIQFMEQVEGETDNRGTIVYDNIIRYNAENQIDLKGAQYVVIDSNIIYGNIGSSDGPLHDLGWNRRALYTITCGTGSESADVIIRRNVIYDSSGAIRGRENWHVFNNTFAGNNRDCSSEFGLSTTPYWGTYDSVATSSYRPLFTSMQQQEDYLTYKNNIACGHNICQVALRDGQAAHIDHNLYHKTGGATFGNWTPATGDWDEYATFAAWKTFLAGEGNVTGKEVNSAEGDPLFTVAPEKPESDQSDPGNEYTRDDFYLQGGSPAIDAGDFHTECDGGGTGIGLTLDDALYFHNGYGITTGDSIIVGSNSAVTILAINYVTNQITVNQAITWVDGDPVSLAYEGSAPDIGAMEYSPGTTTSTSTTSTSTTTTSTSTTSTSVSTTSTSLTSTSVSTTSSSLSTTSTSLSTTSTSQSTSTSISTSTSTTSTSSSTTSTSLSTTSTSLTITSTSTTSTSLSTTLRLIFHLRRDAVLSTRYIERA